MNKYFLFFSLLLWSIKSHAQQERPSLALNDSNYLGKATIATEQMATYLRLSKGQTQRVLKVNIDYYRALLEMIKPKGKGHSDINKELKDLGERRLKEIKTLISGNQFVKYTEYLDSLSSINFSKNRMRGE